MKSYKSLFSKSLRSIPAHLHATAHSHHLRPDVTLAAQIQCQEDSFALADRKWEKIFGEIYPAAQNHVARLLNTGEPESVVFGVNTHEFILRLFSCLSGQGPQRILTTDGEFHSASRQLRRYEEAGLAVVTRVATEPLADFPARFLAEIENEYDLVFFSHVFFNSGYIVPDIGVIVGAVKRAETLVIVDGFHSFMAMPVDGAAIMKRAFYMAGGYKYAMSGESACFMHCPAGYGARPVNTGWFAGFGELANPAKDKVFYANDASRFAGATSEPSGIYRFNAVMDMLLKEKIDVRQVHQRVKELQAQFLKVVPPSLADTLMDISGRGNFLTFRTSAAGDIHHRLMEAGLYTDYRGDRLRFGFGLYHDPEDMEMMAQIVCKRLDFV